MSYANAQALWNSHGCLLVCQYLADLHNITADETLNWKTPWQKRKMETPDISVYLQFTFWEKVYYLDTDEKFPSTKQLPAHWVGVAHNVGDCMTFKLITENMEQEIEHSVVIPAHYATNHTISWDPAMECTTQPSDDIMQFSQQ